MSGNFEEFNKQIVQNLKLTDLITKAETTYKTA